MEKKTRPKLIRLPLVSLLVLGMFSLTACGSLATPQAPTPTPETPENYYGPALFKPFGEGGGIPNNMQEGFNCLTIFDPQYSEPTVQFARDDCRAFNILKEAFNVKGNLDPYLERLYPNIIHLEKKAAIKACGGGGDSCVRSMDEEAPITILNIDDKGPLQGISSQKEIHELAHGLYFLGSSQNIRIDDTCVDVNQRGIRHKEEQHQSAAPISNEIKAILAELLVEAYLNGYSPLDSSYKSAYFENQTPEEIFQYRTAVNKLSLDSNRGDLIKPIKSPDDLVDFFRLIGRISPFERENGISLEMHGLNALKQWTDTIRLDGNLNDPTRGSNFECITASSTTSPSK